MEMNGRQLADFIEVLRPTLDEAGMSTEIACCDGTGWDATRERLAGIKRRRQGKNLGLVTSHGYSSYPSYPFKTDHKTWQTEWSTFDPLNYNWYTAGGRSSDGSKCRVPTPHFVALYGCRYLILTSRSQLGQQHSKLVRQRQCYGIHLLVGCCGEE